MREEPLLDDRTRSSRRRRVGTVVVVGVVAVGLVAAAAWQFAVPSYRPSLAAGEVFGLDVSNHQGADIDWEAAADDGIAFAYIKASEGGDWTDPRFASNWQRAKAAGVRVGAYHFFTLCTEGDLQADHFLDIAPPDADALPPAIDVELGGNCAAPPPEETIAAELTTMIDRVKEATGRDPLLYVLDGFGYLEDDVLAGLPRWERSLFRSPSTSNWAVWQFSHRSDVDGVAGPVDLNVARSTLFADGGS